MKVDAAEAKKTHDAAMQTKDGEIAVLKKQVEDSKITPEALDKQVKARLSVVDRARTVLGDKLVTDGKSDDDIRRQVVAVVLSPEEAKDMTADQIIGAFMAATKETKDSKGSPLARHLSGGPAHSSAQARDQAYSDRNKRLQDAWKGEATKQ